MKTATFVGLCLAMFFLGWFVNDVMRIQKANAAKAIAYKVVPYNYSNSGGQLEAILNAHAKQGWRLHLIEPGGGREGNGVRGQFAFSDSR